MQIGVGGDEECTSNNAAGAVPAPLAEALNGLGAHGGAAVCEAILEPGKSECQTLSECCRRLLSPSMLHIEWCALEPVSMSLAAVREATQYCAS